MQLTNSDALSRTPLRDSLAPAGASGITTPAESFRVVLEEPPTACPSPDGQIQAEEVAADQSAAKSSANEDTESKDDSPASDDKQSMTAAAAIVMPAVVEKEFPQAAQAAEGADETAPSDAAAGDGPAVHAITVAGANADQLPVAALTKSAPSPPDGQLRGLAGGQAARTFRNSETTHVSEIGEHPNPVVTHGTIGDELPEANKRGKEVRESIPLDQHVIEIPTGAADGLESLHTEIENTSPADATTPIAQSGESGLPQNSAASAPHWHASRLPPELLAASSGRLTPETQASEVDSVRLIQRVARAFSVIRDGSGEVRLRLSPPELGALRLDIKVEGGAVIARIEAETSAARTALIENLPALRERLAEQGVRIERFDVDLKPRDERAFDHPANRPRQDHAAQPHLPTRDRRLPQVAEGVIARTVILGDLDQRRLNVLV